MNAKTAKALRSLARERGYDLRQRGYAVTTKGSREVLIGTRKAAIEVSTLALAKGCGRQVYRALKKAA